MAYLGLSGDCFIYLACSFGSQTASKRDSGILPGFEFGCRHQTGLYSPYIRRLSPSTPVPTCWLCGAYKSGMQNVVNKPIRLSALGPEHQWSSYEKPTYEGGRNNDSPEHSYDIQTNPKTKTFNYKCINHQGSYTKPFFETLIYRSHTGTLE